MKRLILALTLMGTALMGNAHASDLIENVKIIAIKTMEVEGNTLSIVTRMKNANVQTLRLSEGRFVFYLRINKKIDKKLTKDERLGTDNRPRHIILEPEETLLEGDGANDIEFKVHLGKSQKTVLRSTKRILNAIGNPAKTKPIFYIVGKFRLGVKSDKGWSSVPAELEWVFRPDFQRRVLLEASPDLVFPETVDQIEDMLRRIPRPVTTTTTTIPDSPIPSTSTTTTSTIPPEPIPITALIHFDYDSDVIRKESYGLLDEYGKAFTNESFSDMRVIIAGHTCHMGSMEYNQELSERRAEAVRNYLLTHHNIAPDRLTTKGYGKTEPVASNATKKGRALNRRVEFIPYYVLPERN